MDKEESDGEDEELVETSFSQKPKPEKLKAHYYYYACENNMDGGLHDNPRVDCPFSSVDFIGVHRYSLSELAEIIDDFSEEHFIQVTENGLLYNGNIKREYGDMIKHVTVKTWGFNRKVNHGYYKNALRFYNEVKLLTSERFKSHPRLVDVAGVCVDRKLAVVYDLEFHKSLYDVISSDDFGWGERIRVAAQLADLMADLHDERYVLFVFNSSCVMVDESYNVKQFDLGHVCRVKSIDRNIALTVLTKRIYCYAPECLKEGKYSAASDVYAFGSLLLELMSHEAVYNRTESLLDKWNNSCGKMTFVPSEVDSLVRKCLREDPQSRPTMKDVCLAFQEIASNLESSSNKRSKKL